MDWTTRQVFTLRLEYFATGEGVRIWTMVVVEWSEAGARERFWTTCFANSASAREYFGPGLEVSPGFDRTRLRGLTEEFLDHLEMRARTSGAFAYQTYWSYNLT